MRKNMLAFVFVILSFSITLFSCSNDIHNHIFDSFWKYDSNYHWHECNGCHAVSDKEEHSFEETIISATYEHGGYIKHTCKCGYCFVDNEVEKIEHHYSNEWSFDSLKHWHSCTDVGYESLKLDESSHTFENIITQPSYDESGYTTHQCFCGYSYTDSYVDRLHYTILFDLNDGSSKTGILEQRVHSCDEISFFFDCEKVGWNFRGWSFNGNKVFDEKGNKISNFEMSSEMLFVALYSQTAVLTITTNMPEAGTVTGFGEYSFNSYVDINAFPNVGYLFDGWYYQGILLSNVTSYKYMMWDQDITIEARFSLNSFKLNVHTNNGEYGLVLIDDTSNNNYLEKYEIYKEYTSQIQISAYSKTNVRFLGWYDDTNNLVSTNAVYSFAMPNHDYILEAKWNYFTIDYNLDGGTNDFRNPTSYSTDDDDISLYNPTKLGYSFIGWEYNNSLIEFIDTSIAQNISLKAIWEATEYRIIYELYGGTNNPQNPSSYCINSDSITFLSPAKSGYSFEGWYYEPSYYNLASSISSGSIGDVHIYAKWNAVIYSIVYNLDGGTNNENNPINYTVESNISLCDPIKDGYHFDGWFDENDNQRLSIATGTTGDLVLTAKWSATKNNLTVISEDLSKGIVSIICGSGFSYEQITVVAIPSNNCIFKGWYHNSVEISHESTYSFTMPCGDYSLVAHFSTQADELKRLGATPTLSEDGKTITYGLYPQKYINDSSLVSILNSLTNPTINGWYLFEDNYYAKVSATPFFSTKFNSSFDDGTIISSGTTYWFKCEPIIWNVLSNDSGEYYIVSSILLDAVCYSSAPLKRTIDGQDVYSSNYEFSDIREWLNGDFYNTAFALNNSNIKTTFVDNSLTTTQSFSSYVCHDTEDKVFLPSYKDYLNNSYGFSEFLYPTETRCCRVTEWARARGAYYSWNEDDYKFNGDYWTRSPAEGNTAYIWSNTGASATSNGAKYGVFVDESYTCARPALMLSF